MSRPVVISVTVDGQRYQVVVARRPGDYLLIAEVWEPSKGNDHAITMASVSRDIWGLVRSRRYVADGSDDHLVDSDRYRAHVLARQSAAHDIIARAIPLNDMDLRCKGAVTLMAGLGETRTNANLKKAKKK